MRLAVGAVLVWCFATDVAGAQSTGTEKTAGGAKPSQAGTGAKKAATQPPERLDPNAPSDEACVVEKDSYERLLKGLAQEAKALDEFRRQRAGQATQGEYDRCYTAFVQSEPFIKIVGSSGPNAKTAAKVEEALEHRCGKNPRTQWTKDKVKKQLDLIEFLGAQHAGMTQQCYAQFKEVAAFFCNLDKEAQDYAMEYGIEQPGRGKAKWKFSAEHAKLIAPKCADLKLGLNSIENPPSTKR